MKPLYFLCLEVCLTSLLSLSFLNSILLFFSFKSSKCISEPKLRILLIFLGPLLILEFLDLILHLFKFGHFLSFPLILKRLLHPHLQELHFPLLPLDFLPNFLMLPSKLRLFLLVLPLLNPVPLLLAGDLINLLIVKLLLLGLLHLLLLIGLESADLRSGVVELVYGLHLTI